MQKEKITIKIDGMTCVNCSNSIEKVVKKLDGVSDVNVNFSTGSGIFTYEKHKISQKQIEDKIKKLGFRVLAKEETKENINGSILALFLIALIGTIFLHVSRHIFNDASTYAYSSFIVASIVQFIPGFIFYKHSYQALSNKTSDMNVLVALGTSVAYFYSVFVVFFPNLFPENLRFIYFDGSSMIITFILLGRYIESKARKKATNFMQKLLDLSPKHADSVQDDGKIIQKKLDELKIDDIFMVKPGQNIALDGVVITGNGEVDTSLMSGESISLNVKAGSEVLAGYTLKNGFLHVKVQKEYNNTKLSEIIELLSNASSTKMPIARIADKVSSVFVPAVILIAFLTFCIWFLLGDAKMAILASSCVLIISCPCALGLATPIAIVSGIGRGAKEGIFVKNPEVLEVISKIKYAVFDKTGTLTKGDIRVSKSSILDIETLSKIASVESMSEHPISSAIKSFAIQEGANSKLDIKNFSNIAGYGVKGFYANEEITIGTEEFLTREGIEIPKNIYDIYMQKLHNGESSVIASIDKKAVGIFSFEDTIKTDAKDLIEFLKEKQIITVMLTGDKEEPAKKVAKNIGVEIVMSEVLPDEKYSIIQKFQKNGKVLFVGDGINDSLALRASDIGIAMNSGADIAKDAGDIILTKNNLSGVKDSINLSKNIVNIIYQNLFWAFIYNIIGIPLAAGLFYPLTITPAYAGIAMSISSVTVVLNSLRLKVKSLN